MGPPCGRVHKVHQTEDEDVCFANSDKQSVHVLLLWHFFVILVLFANYFLMWPICHHLRRVSVTVIIICVVSEIFLSVRL